MTIYYVATLARYVLVEADNETQAGERGEAALREMYAEERGRGKSTPIRIAIVRLATDDEIELMRWHKEHVASEHSTKQFSIADLLGEPLLDRSMQDKTDWTPMSVPGRENADGTETPTTWFAYNRATRQSVRFATLEEAAAFCFHPDNQR